MVTDYAWDSRDRLREVLLPDGRKARYQYDAFGRRVRKEIVPAARGDFAGMLALATKDGVDALPPIERTEFIWDGDVIAQEIHSGDAPAEKTYVHEPGTFVPMLHEEQGAVFTYVVDHLGTPRELIDRDGRVAWAGSFSAWGRVDEEYRDPKCRWRVEVPWRLLGQYADAETGLCSTRFRYFDAEAGRWLSPDPLGLAGGKNLHAFDGAPTVEVDPWGLACGDAKEAAEGTTRVRHYTNRKGANGIEQDGVITARDNNRVYVELASRKPLGQIEAETTYQLKTGRGRDYVETDVANSRLEWVNNPRYGTPELTVKGDLALQNSTIVRRK